MTDKRKARHQNGAGNQKERDQNYTRDDPLLGWFSLGKRVRFERTPKRGWGRGGRDHG